MRRLAALLLILFATVTAASAARDQPSFQELEESLTCQCGCGLTVHACNHLQCPSAIPLRQEIRAQMAKGLNKDQILAHFQEKYGEKILSSPTTRGFNLTAWLMPFVALGFGALFVVVTLVRWQRRGQQRTPRSSPVLQPVDEAQNSAHQKTLERELERFDS